MKLLQKKKTHRGSWARQRSHGMSLEDIAVNAGARPGNYHRVLRKHLRRKKR